MSTDNEDKTGRIVIINPPEIVFMVDRGKSVDIGSHVSLKNTLDLHSAVSGNKNSDPRDILATFAVNDVETAGVLYSGKPCICAPLFFKRKQDR